MLSRTYHKLLDIVQTPDAAKRRRALRHWKMRKKVEGRLVNDHYGYFYTSHFGLNHDWHVGKHVLDVGCGPRGSLEWARGALQRIGLDPLAADYREFGVDAHEMTYVAGCAEYLPFQDASFNLVSALNSLDHVDDLSLVIAEIMRVVAPNGFFFLITDIHAEPTIREPQTFSWDVVDRFKPTMSLMESHHFEKNGGMLKSIREATPFDHHDTTPRYGVLSAKFVKTSAPTAEDERM